MFSRVSSHGFEGSVHHPLRHPAHPLCETKNTHALCCSHRQGPDSQCSDPAAGSRTGREEKQVSRGCVGFRGRRSLSAREQPLSSQHPLPCSWQALCPRKSQTNPRGLPGDTKAWSLFTVRVQKHPQKSHRLCQRELHSLTSSMLQMTRYCPEGPTANASH